MISVPKLSPKLALVALFLLYIFSLVPHLLPYLATPVVHGRAAAETAQPEALVDFQAAYVVLGQSVFHTNSPGNLNLPTQAVVDPTTGKVFVADNEHNRVLRFTSAAAATNGGPYEVKFGRDGPGLSQTHLDNPWGLAIDAAGRLWVADTGNNRVLRFDNAANLPESPSASGVLGKPDFTTEGQTTTQSGISGAYSISIDSAGRLWVADTFNHRILRFDNAAAKPNGAPADGVLGQPSFVTANSTLARNGMQVAWGVFADDNNRVWVADRLHNRVLRFDNAAAKPNGADADGVLGQPDFVSAWPGLAQNRFRQPVGVAVDSFGRLYVSDYYNRVMTS